tara:strand:- start:927 stop:1085 length:159 start_codon:yes stop_codon:yes gene_type:complete
LSIPTEPLLTLNPINGPFYAGFSIVFKNIDYLTLFFASAASKYISILECIYT